MGTEHVTLANCLVGIEETEKWLVIPGNCTSSSSFWLLPPRFGLVGCFSRLPWNIKALQIKGISIIFAKRGRTAEKIAKQGRSPIFWANFCGKLEQLRGTKSLRPVFGRPYFPSLILMISLKIGFAASDQVWRMNGLFSRRRKREKVASPARREIRSGSLSFNFPPSFFNA